VDTRRNHSRTEAGGRGAEGCKDTIRFRLVGANGRHHFKSVWFRGANGHLPDDLAEIVKMLEGHWLDEINTEALKRMQCRSHHSRHCLQDVAEIVADMQEMLLPLGPRDSLLGPHRSRSLRARTASDARPEGLGASRS